MSADMITLAHLNKGSILAKVAKGKPFRMVDLIPEKHSDGKWDQCPDRTALMKFDVVLTHPPFGEDRAYRPETPFDHEVIEMYETWRLAGETSTTWSRVP